MPTRKVLTVNQVFEIMLEWVKTRDWEQALYTVVPKRKFQGRSGLDKAGTKEDDVETMDHGEDRECNSNVK
jgi:tRNA (guanine9-N1)-methyltransferase